MDVTMRLPAVRACFENPERGCVVLDQPQQPTKPRAFGISSCAAAGLRHSRAPFSKHAVRNLLTAIPLLLALDAIAAPVDFVREVRPIFQKHCYECHGEKKQKSGLRLDLKAAALKGGDEHAPDILPGKATESPLIRFVTSQDDEERMPPKGERLSAAEITTLTAWIDLGAVCDERVIEKYPFIPGPRSFFRIDSPPETVAVTGDHSVKWVEVSADDSPGGV